MSRWRRIRVLEWPAGQKAVPEERTLQSICESSLRACHDGYKRKMGSKVHTVVDTIGLDGYTVRRAGQGKRRSSGAGVGGSGLSNFTEVLYLFRTKFLNESNAVESFR